jgi:hypothetical protein
VNVFLPCIVVYASKIILHLLHSHGVDILVVQQAQKIFAIAGATSRNINSRNSNQLQFSSRRNAVEHL